MTSAKFTPKGSNPFKPGAGRQPPLLAGREDISDLFDTRLGQMEASGQGLGMLIYGPRGMGKTVLMKHLQKRFEKSGVPTVWTYPSKGSVPTKALTNLLPKGFSMGELQFSAGTGHLTELAYALKATWSLGKDRQGLFTDHLQAACKKTSRVLLLDEAHTLDKEEATELLNMVQTVYADSRFLLVLIGTPGLPQIIRRAGTFGERFERTSLDMLSEDAAQDALRVPLKKGGIDIDTECLLEAVRDAQCYPFFIQQWGEALWNCAAQDGAQRLTDAQVQKAQSTVAGQRGEFYSGRLDEIGSNAELFAATVAVADAFLAARQFDRQGIAELIRLALEDRIPEETKREEQAETLLQELIAIGYIWKPVRAPYLQPGIPSLMAYIAQHRDKRHPRIPEETLLQLSQESRHRATP